MGGEETVLFLNGAQLSLVVTWVEASAAYSAPIHSSWELVGFCAGDD